MVALLQQGHMSFLSLCQYPKLQSGLPSWIPDWSRSAHDMLQDVENDHVTIYPTFGASGVKRYHSGIRVLRTNGSVDRISVVCSVYDSIEAAGSFPGRVSSHEVPIPETDSWPKKWLVEILRLTYGNKQRFVDFGDRLRAAARTSIAGVGFNQEARPGRVGDSRFPDAVVLLKNGVHLITEDHIRSEVRRFLADKAVQKLAQGKTALKTRLSSEIIDKSLGRLPFTTAKGHLVMTSEHVKRGDVVALIKGSQVPFVLRRRTSGTYQLISEAYVDGIMDGGGGHFQVWPSGVGLATATYRDLKRAS